MSDAKSSEKTTSFGSCAFNRITPPREEIKPDTKKLNVIISFEEVLKLQLAIQAWLLKSNKLKRNSMEGKLSAMNLVLDYESKNVSVMPEKLKK